MDTPLDRYNVLRPDVFHFSKPRLHLVGRKRLKKPPDLCVEVISPSSRRIDRAEKFDLYRKHGVAHYWIVDPTPKTIESFQLVGGEYTPSGSGAGADKVKLPPFAKLEIPLQFLWWTTP